MKCKLSTVLKQSAVGNLWQSFSSKRHFEMQMQAAVDTTNRESCVGAQSERLGYARIDLLFKCASVAQMIKNSKRAHQVMKIKSTATTAINRTQKASD